MLKECGTVMMTQGAGPRRKRKQQPRYERHMRGQTCPVRDIKRKNGEAPIDELQSEDYSHHEQEILEREHVTKRHARRSLVSFVVVMAAMALRHPRPWHVSRLRTVQGLFAGYGAPTSTMAADSAPKERWRRRSAPSDGAASRAAPGRLVGGMSPRPPAGAGFRVASLFDLGAGHAGSSCLTRNSVAAAPRAC